MSADHVAQPNLGYVHAPLDSDEMAEFRLALEEWGFTTRIDPPA